MLTRRELSIVGAVLNPRLSEVKQIAFDLGISHLTQRKYLCDLYQKIGLSHDGAFGNLRLLALWAVAHHEALQVSLPTPEQFAKGVK